MLANWYKREITNKLKMNVIHIAQTLVFRSLDCIHHIQDYAGTKLLLTVIVTYTFRKEKNTDGDKSQSNVIILKYGLLSVICFVLFCLCCYFIGF